LGFFRFFWADLSGSASTLGERFSFQIGHHTHFLGLPQGGICPPAGPQPGYTYSRTQFDPWAMGFDEKKPVRQGGQRRLIYKNRGQGASSFFSVDFCEKFRSGMGKGGKGREGRPRGGRDQFPWGGEPPRGARDAGNGRNFLGPPTQLPIFGIVHITRCFRRGPKFLQLWGRGGRTHLPVGARGYGGKPDRGSAGKLSITGTGFWPSAPAGK